MCLLFLNDSIIGFSLDGFVYVLLYLHGPGGERIVDVVPGETELEPLGLRREIGQAAHTRNNPHVKSTGVY
jgi:hypothetical protein